MPVAVVGAITSPEAGSLIYLRGLSTAMFKQDLIRALLSVGAVAGAAASAHAATFIPNDPAYPDIRITEYMYKNGGSPGEFVQFTNLGTTAVDMSGWSEDDGSGTPGVHSLAGLGTLQPGQSGILAEATQAAFDAAWGLSSSVPYVVENSTDNLGSADSIYLFDGNNIVDLLTYGTGTGPKTSGVAAVPGSASVIGTNNWSGWVLLTAGTDGAITADGDVASPGYSSFATPVPLPAAAWLLVSGMGALAPVVRRRKQAAEPA
jgi:Lamin Tail Domain